MLIDLTPEEIQTAVGSIRTHLAECATSGHSVGAEYELIDKLESYVKEIDARHVRGFGRDVVISVPCKINRATGLVRFRDVPTLYKLGKQISEHIEWDGGPDGHLTQLGFTKDDQGTMRVDPVHLTMPVNYTAKLPHGITVKVNGGQEGLRDEYQV